MKRHFVNDFNKDQGLLSLLPSLFTFSYFPIYHSLKFVWHALFMIHSNDVHFSDDIEDLGK
jgi:hypothetical protein